MKKKYPNLDIGFSSHENPEMNSIAPLALALGATSFEKTCRCGDTRYKEECLLYFAEDQFKKWLKSLDEADEILGQSNKRYISSIKESESLRKLQRGSFC